MMEGAEMRLTYIPTQTITTQLGRGIRSMFATLALLTQRLASLVLQTDTKMLCCLDLRDFRSTIDSLFGKGYQKQF